MDAFDSSGANWVLQDGSVECWVVENVLDKGWIEYKLALIIESDLELVRIVSCVLEVSTLID